MTPPSPLSPNSPFESAAPRGESPIRLWKLRGQELETGRFPLLMGILNLTPDSFSDGGRFQAIDHGVEQARKLLEEGADLLDIGGESTRPGATPVPLDEELARVIPAIERIASLTAVPISIDTTKAEVARRALAVGASIVNDSSGLQFDSDMPEVCVAGNAGVICMHIQGTPKTMQDAPHYTDVVAEICTFLQERLVRLSEQGIPPERVVLDPGIGFGKTPEHNLSILSQIGHFRALGRPVCIGHSRKRFLKKLLGKPVDERTSATVGISVALAIQSTDIIRVHDVGATRDALLAWRAVADAAQRPAP